MHLSSGNVRHIQKLQTVAVSLRRIASLDTRPTAAPSRMGSFLPIPPNCDFTWGNLPYGIFSTKSEPNKRVGVAIGEQILDLSKIGCFSGPILSKCSNVFEQDSLNSFMELGPAAWTEARRTLQRVLSSNEGFLRDNARLRDRALIPQKDATLHLPAKIGNFTDFSSSKKHAENDRIMFTDDHHNINQNWNYMPVAYHGRASSVILSGTPVRRPNGQRLSFSNQPVFGPTEQLDFEVELGALIGTGNDLGRPIPVDEAEKHVFGMVLLNDWSARDMQSWEWKPLGCFVSKSYATTISPWVVTMQALEPFRCEMLDLQHPTPLPYLRQKKPSTFNISLRVRLSTNGGQSTTHLSTTNYKYMYWTLAQQIAHHTSNGCSLKSGDLLGSGTISGPTKSSAGSISELSERGSAPVMLDNSEARSFIHDGDEVTVTGRCEKDGTLVGFGSCAGKILPAVQFGSPGYQ